LARKHVINAFFKPQKKERKQIEKAKKKAKMKRRCQNKESPNFIYCVLKEKISCNSCPPKLQGESRNLEYTEIKNETIFIQKRVK